MEPIVRSEKQLAAAIRRFRKLANLTQGDLATRANKRQATISNLESGSGTLETLFAALSALELEIVVRRRSRDRAPDMGDLF
ncbi:helix-turn-helix domain-containing protein [Brevundimonas sp. BR2-1]|uniref:helix-turn-helix domain-containing protein n=1 Tax=Brevundimonas sp. BR2-1 TaxID=3031123 RepID=UPI0030AE8A76